MGNKKFVEFYDSRACVSAVEKMQGVELDAGGVLDLRYAWDYPRNMRVTSEQLRHDIVRRGGGSSQHEEGENSEEEQRDDKSRTRRPSIASHGDRHYRPNEAREPQPSRGRSRDRSRSPEARDVGFFEDRTANRETASLKEGRSEEAEIRRDPMSSNGSVATMPIAEEQSNGKGVDVQKDPAVGANANIPPTNLMTQMSQLLAMLQQRNQNSKSE